MAKDRHDISRIPAPKSEPPQQPDIETEVEGRIYDSKALTPTQKVDILHNSLVVVLNGEIDHHKGECSSARQEIKELQDRLEDERQTSHSLGLENTQLRERSWATGWMGMWGTIFVGLGSAAFGFAGCWPDLTNEAKYPIGAAGLAFVICGIILSVLSYNAGVKKPLPQSTQS